MDWLDFYHIYLVGCVQTVAGFHFFTKCMKKKANLIFYALFAVFELLSFSFLPDGVMMLAVFILPLLAAGIFLYKADFSTALLYAIVTAEIMQLSFGISNSVLCLVYPYAMSADAKLLAFVSVIADGAALFAAILCYYVIHRYFISYETEKSKYSLIILTHDFTDIPDWRLYSFFLFWQCDYRAKRRRYGKDGILSDACDTAFGNIQPVLYPVCR